MLRQELYIFKYIVPGCNIQFPFKYFSKYAFIIRIISSLKLWPYEVLQEEWVKYFPFIL